MVGNTENGWSERSCSCIIPSIQALLSTSYSRELHGKGLAAKSSGILWVLLLSGYGAVNLRHVIVVCTSLTFQLQNNALKIF